jgi:hypothetical protein
MPLLTKAQRQKIHNKIKKHLLTQKAKSTEADSHRCMYRGANGKKCAIGGLIPDKTYDPIIEGCGIDVDEAEYYCQENPEGFKLLQAILTSIGISCKKDKYWLAEYQNIHDCSEVQYWSDQLEELAIANKLKP